MFKCFGCYLIVLLVIGLFMVGYLILVCWINWFMFDFVDVYDVIEVDLFVIVVMWYGQYFMVLFVKLKYWLVKVMIFCFVDGEVNVIVVCKFGLGLICVFGGCNVYQIKKCGGMCGFIEVF